MVANHGAYLSGNGPGAAAVAASTAHGGVYDIPAIAVDVRGAFTNTVPVDAYRGAGKPEANYIIERCIEAAARTARPRSGRAAPAEPDRVLPAQDRDGHDHRFRRLRRQSRSRRRCAPTLRGFEARRAEAKARGKLRGIGIGCFLETSRGAPNEGAEVRFETDGTVTVAVGTESNGQGHETAFAQIAADRLGVPMEAIRYVQADTRAVKSGAGHGGARSMHMGGAAVVKAIDAALAKARRLAAHLLQASEAELVLDGGGFAVRGSERRIELLGASRARAARAFGEHVMNMTDVFTFPSGCHVAEVEIDPETGAATLVRYTAVDDYGRLINPLLTEGQVQGGVAQGIGQALLEHTVYDPGVGPAAERLVAWTTPCRAPTTCRPSTSTLVERPTARQSAGRQGLGPGRLHRRAADRDGGGARRAAAGRRGGASTCRRRRRGSGRRSARR